MSKAKKQEDTFKIEVHRNMFEYGMNPVNAVWAAAMNAGMSIKKTRDLAKKYEGENVASIILGDGINEIAERNYASIHARVRKLSQKAGLFPGGEGKAESVRSAGESFVSVDDNHAQLEAIKELNRMTGVTGPGAGDEEEARKHVSINLVMPGSTVVTEPQVYDMRQDSNTSRTDGH